MVKDNISIGVMGVKDIITYNDGGTICIKLDISITDIDNNTERRVQEVCIDKRFDKDSPTYGRMYWGYPIIGRLIDDVDLERRIINDVKNYVSYVQSCVDKINDIYISPVSDDCKEVNH